MVVARPFAAPPGRQVARRRCPPACAVKKGKEKNVVCTKTLIAKGEHRDDVERLCGEYYETIKGAYCGRRTGVLSFECNRDTFDDNVFHFFERYTTTDKFQDMMGKEETKTFLENVSALRDRAADPPHDALTAMRIVRFDDRVQVNEYLEKPVGMALYEYVDGRMGNACVGIGPKGEGGLDDATGANKYGGGARYEQTSTTLQL